MSGPERRDGSPAGLADAVQQFGLLSAAAVVDRYVAVVDRVVSSGVRAVTGPGPAGPGPAAAAPGWGGPVPDLGETATAAVRALLQVIGTPAAPPHRDAPAAVVLPGTDPGRRAEGRLWVHGPRDRATTVALHTTGLVSARGTALDAARVTLTPEVVDVPAGGSAEIVVVVDVPGDTRPGTYHGTLVASAERARPLGVVLHVRGPGAGDGT